MLCSNSVNIYVGIGIPWLIDTAYNFIAYREPLRIPNAAGLSFSLLIFFATSTGCIAVLVLRRITLGAELGGPRLWAWVTSVYFMLLWIVFVVLSSLRVCGIIWVIIGWFDIFLDSSWSALIVMGFWKINVVRYSEKKKTNLFFCILFAKKIILQTVCYFLNIYTYDGLYYPMTYFYCLFSSCCYYLIRWIQKCLLELDICLMW